MLQQASSSPMHVRSSRTASPTALSTTRMLPISTKLVLKVKYKADRTYDKDKARLVTQGFLARAGVDFFSTFSPIAQLTGVRALFAVGTHLNT